MRAACIFAAMACCSMGTGLRADEFNVPAPAAGCKTDAAKGTYCTLAEAMAAANARSGLHAIHLAQRAVYQIRRSDHEAEGGNGLPAVSGTIVIEGNGAIVERDDAMDTPDFRLMRVLPRGELTLRNLTLRRGATSLGFDGAAIWNMGNLTLSSCTLEDNHSGDDGGAIRSDGSLLVKDSTFRRNSALAQGRIGGTGGVGGAIQTHTQFGKGVARIEHTVFENNEADASRGAIWLMGETTIVQATLTGTRAGERGGGIMNYGTLDLRKSRLVGNVAGDAGGGIYAFGPATVADTELSGNRAAAAGDCDGHVSGCDTNVALRGGD